MAIWKVSQWLCSSKVSFDTSPKKNHWGKNQFYIITSFSCTRSILNRAECSFKTISKKMIKNKYNTKCISIWDHLNGLKMQKVYLHVYQSNANYMFLIKHQKCLVKKFSHFCEYELYSATSLVWKLFGSDSEHSWKFQSVFLVWDQLRKLHFSA